MKRFGAIVFLLSSGLVAQSNGIRVVHQPSDTTQRFDPETRLPVAEETKLDPIFQFDPKAGLSLYESSAQPQPPPKSPGLKWHVKLTNGVTYWNCILSSLERDTLYVVQRPINRIFRTVTTPISVESIKGLQQRSSVAIGIIGGTIGGFIGGILGFYVGFLPTDNYESAEADIGFTIGAIGGVISGGVLLPILISSRYDFLQMTTEEKHHTLRIVIREQKIRRITPSLVGFGMSFLLFRLILFVV